MDKQMEQAEKLLNDAAAPNEQGGASNFESKIKGDLKRGRKEIEHATNLLEKSSEQFEIKLKEQLAKFEQKIAELVEETFVLKKLPSKIWDRLNELVPVIATEVQKKAFQGYDAAFARCTEAVTRLNNEVENSINKIEKTKSGGSKRKVGFTALVLTVTILASTILTYFVMQQLPHSVSIDTKGIVNINGGNISVWGLRKNMVQTKSAKPK